MFFDECEYGGNNANIPGRTGCLLFLVQRATLLATRPRARVRVRIVAGALVQGNPHISLGFTAASFLHAARYSISVELACNLPSP